MSNLERQRLLLEADGRGGLLELILEAVGAVVTGRFELIELLAVGRQNIVFSALDRRTGRTVVVKQPLFDYRRPIDVSRREVARRRAALVEHRALLAVAPAGVMPAPVALVTAPAIIAAAHRGAVFGPNETFLVEEHARGTVLSNVTPLKEEERAARMASALFRFVRDLRAIGWLYVDLNAENLLFEPSGRLRVVDAGGAQPIRAGRIEARDMTPAFTTPRLLDALEHRETLPGDLSSVLPLMAKVLHFALTGRTPMNGVMPDLTLLAGRSGGCVAAIEAMLAVDGAPALAARAEAALTRWVHGTAVNV